MDAHTALVIAENHATATLDELAHAQAVLINRCQTAPNSKVYPFRLGQIVGEVIKRKNA